MFDDGHILRSVAASQPRKIVVEDDVQDPVEPVLDAPMSADNRGEGLGVEFGGGR
jgi:hypothetical protein